MKKLISGLIAAAIFALPAQGISSEPRTGRGASASATAAADVFPWGMFLATLLVVGGTVAIIASSNSSSPSH